MTSAVYPLVLKITQLFVLAQALSTWEMCAIKFIDEKQPSSVSFICKSDLHCPVNSLYKKLNMPSQTLFGLATHELPVFQRDDLVFIIDDRIVSWNNETATKYRLGGRNDFKLVIVANMSENSHDDIASMSELFAALWLSGIVRSTVLLVNGTSSHLYTYLPFKNGSMCEDTSPVVIGECSRGTDKVFDMTYKVFNLNQCPIRIAQIDHSSFISYPLRGRLTPLLIELVRRINGSSTPLKNDRGSACKEKDGIRGMVYNGTAHMATASLVQRDCSTLEYLSSDYNMCLSWCTPVLSAMDYVYSFLLHQLQIKVWLALLGSVTIMLIGVSLFNAISLESWPPHERFNLVLLIYAQPPPTKRRGFPARLVVGTWLCACLVLRGTYEGEMKSQSTTQLDSHIIYTLEELSETDLSLCATASALQILETADNPVIQKIFKRAKVCNLGLYENAVEAARLKDRATLCSDIICLAAASRFARDKMPLYPWTGGCIQMIQFTPVVTVAGSPFRETWRSVLKRCDQAGLILKWLNLRPPLKDRGGARPFSFKQFLPALFVLCLGCATGCLFLVGENVHFRWSRRKPSLRKTQ